MFRPRSAFRIVAMTLLVAFLASLSPICLDDLVPVQQQAPMGCCAQSSSDHDAGPVGNDDCGCVCHCVFVTSVKIDRSVPMPLVARLDDPAAQSLSPYSFLPDHVPLT